jgi:co-chaperonin GroES (HSP10)
MKSFPRDAEDMGVAETDSTIPKLDLGDNDNGDNNTEDLQISAKDAIRQNQELFKDLLGDKKARGQDISDMLLRFSGSQGDTLGEKFQNYTRAEAAAGPGRSEKISQTAAGLAINDFVAGKRSKEQIEALKGKIDYEYGKKAEMVNVQPGDSVQTALFKISKKGDVKPDSDKAYKFLIQMKTGSDRTFRIDKVKMKDLDKPKAQKKLKIGFNIIEEDGRKNIVQWDGTNYDILSISQIWKG